MTGYEKGTTPEGEMNHIREAFAKATTAIYAWPDAAEARQAADDLQELINDLRGQAARFRGHLAAYLMDAHGLSVTELAAFLGVSRPRASQMISAARERGNPVTEPLTLPEQPHIVLAVITSDRGVLIARREDKIPPWTFLGGEVESGETPDHALRRKGHAGAYRRIPLEIEADWLARRTLATAVPDPEESPVAAR